MKTLMRRAAAAVGHWVYGLVAAVIGGGASAVVSGVTVGIVKPDDFNLQAGFNNTLMVMWISFVLHGIISGAMFLKQSPLPRWDGKTERRSS